MASKRWLLAPLLLVVGGCSTAPIAVNYAPSSTMTMHGQETVGKFRYLPAESAKVKPNQIRNTAMGNIYLDKNISKLFQIALFDESRFVGIKMNTGPTITGTINEFLMDDLGYSVDWTLDVSYKVTSAGSAKSCYSGEKVVKKHTAKFANAFGTLNDVMKLNIEKLFQDPAFARCIQAASS